MPSPLCGVDESECGGTANPCVETVGGKAAPARACTLKCLKTRSHPFSSAHGNSATVLRFRYYSRQSMGSIKRFSYIKYLARLYFLDTELVNAPNPKPRSANKKWPMLPFSAWSLIQGVCATERALNQVQPTALCPKPAVVASSATSIHNRIPLGALETADQRTPHRRARHSYRGYAVH